MSDDQLAELKQHLDQRFAEQDERLDARFAEQDAKLDQRIDALKADFTQQFRDFRLREDEKAMKLFNYIRDEMTAVHAEIKTVNDRLDSVYSAIDVVAKQQETDQHERLAMSHQLDRHERWHHQTAAKVGVKLDYQEP